MNPVRLVPGMVLILGMLAPHGAGSGAAAQSAGSPPSQIQARHLLVEAAKALADSVNMGLSTARLPVRMTADGRVRLDIGAKDGVRTWSTLTLTSRNSAWKGTVADLNDDYVVLSVAPGPAGKHPEAGQIVNVRLEMKSLAITSFEPGPLGGRGAVHFLLTSLGAALREKSGMDMILVPGLPHSGDARAVALEAGADLMATVEARLEKDVLVIGLALAPLRGGAEAGSIAIRLPAGPSAAADLAFLGDTLEAAPPGSRFDTITPDRPGQALDLFRSRFQPGDLLVVFPDRIETLRFESGRVTTVSSKNLEEIWPRTIPTRWPVAGVLPVNSIYGKDRREEKVFYAICSNERPKFLVLGLDRMFPDSLDLSVSQEPGEARTTSFDSCFPRVDRVQRPENYRRPQEMPEDAVSRMTLGEIVTGPAGVPVMDDSGRPRTRRVAVIYYHENSASL